MSRRASTADPPTMDRPSDPRTGRRRALRGVVAFGVVVALLAAGFAGSGLAHANHVIVRDQLSGDGTVLVEQVVMLEPGFLVLHADDGGEPGDVLAHTTLEPGVSGAIEMQVPGDYWSRQERLVTLWAVIHFDDGDGEFDPEDDPMARSLGSLSGRPFTVGAEAGTVHVVGEPKGRQRTSGTVSIHRVAIDAPGFVAIHDVENGTIGRPVGATAIGEGTHFDVDVALEAGYVANQSDSFLLYAVPYRDDGDGTFDPEADTAVTVGGNPIRSLFRVQRVAPNATDDGSLVTTATPTVAPTAAPVTPSPAAVVGTTPGQSQRGPARVVLYTVGGGLAGVVLAGLWLRLSG